MHIHIMHSIIPYVCEHGWVVGLARGAVLSGASGKDEDEIDRRLKEIDREGRSLPFLLVQTIFIGSKFTNFLIFQIFF
jgi:hypothetical protein